MIRQAMMEVEKDLHFGKNFCESIHTFVVSQKETFSKNFPETNAVRKLPGIVRNFQENPFKLLIGNYDQLRLGAEYLNKTEWSMICIDSSGKFWAEKQKKSEAKKLNTAIVIPPKNKGLSPFPIFEQISISNKTIDFLVFLQYAWHFMSVSTNDQPVKAPKVAVSDFSFPNFHSILKHFNGIKIQEYLDKTFTILKNKEEFCFHTVLTVCESHLLPVLLKCARAIEKNKVIADTVIAALLLVLGAKDLDTAVLIWTNLVEIHCSKRLSHESREAVKIFSYGDDIDEIDSVNFDNDEEDPEEIKYGKRRTLRSESPFFRLFMMIILKLEAKEEDIANVDNDMYAPELVKKICKEYLSLFPLMSASLLGTNLKNNAYVELYWQWARRIFSDVPKRILWPPVYLGILNEQIQRMATEILVMKTIPNIRKGGRRKGMKTVTFLDGLDTENKSKTNIFKPTASKKVSKKNRENESFDGSFEQWDSKKRKESPRNQTYIKNKVLDYSTIVPSKGQPSKQIRVSGPKTPEARSGNTPQEIVLSENDIEQILKKYEYIGTETVDAGLTLIDRKLNEDANFVENVTVYNTQTCRLILTIDQSLVKQGFFLAMIPRSISVEQEAKRLDTLIENMKKGYNEHGDNQVPDVLAGHFTLVSNIHCQPGEVSVYETLDAYRNPDSLLTKSGKRLLKILCNLEGKSLKIKCINVSAQLEHECGALGIALAVQLCFSAQSERKVFRSMTHPREDLLSCLQGNDLRDFRSIENPNFENEVLFSMNI